MSASFRAGKRQVGADLGSVETIREDSKLMSPRGLEVELSIRGGI